MIPSRRGHSDDPRARAAATKRYRSRRALLEAADAIFASHGWAGTRVEDVAATAGVSPATAYNHFATKHALIGHVYAPLVRPLIAQATADLARERPVVDALVDQLRALARVCARNRALTAAFWSGAEEYAIRVGGQATDGDEQDPRTIAPVPDTIRGLIERGQRTGELRGYPPALELSGILVNVLLMRSLVWPDEPHQDTARILVTLALGALAPELIIAGRAGGWSLSP